MGRLYVSLLEPMDMLSMPGFHSRYTSLSEEGKKIPKLRKLQLFEMISLGQCSHTSC